MKRTAMQVCAIGFDFDHTLGLDHKLEIAAFVELARHSSAVSQRGFDEERARVAITREISHYRSGRCSLDHAIALACEDALGEGTGDRTNVDAFRVMAVDMAPHYVQALPGVPELLRLLDGSAIPYAILSNGWNPLQQRKADLIGFSKPVFVSDDIGVRKPSVHAFRVLCDYFAIPASRIWYVGDDPKVDVLGSLGAGMRAIWFDGEGAKFPTDIPAPTAIVTNIRDVFPLISEA